MTETPTAAWFVYYLLVNYLPFPAAIFNNCEWWLARRMYPGHLADSGVRDPSHDNQLVRSERSNVTG